MIDIDGSFGEGGGQIVRSSLALSLLTGQAFRLRQIRANRPKPGLQPQHLMSVRASATIGNAVLHGDRPGSAQFTFEPGAVKAGNYRFAIGTAGATSLVLHTVYLPLMMHGEAHSELTLEGGTHVIKSPSYHFLDVTWRAHLASIGMDASLQLKRHGFYPRGGGEIRAVLTPTKSIQPLQLLDRPTIRQAKILSAVADLDESIAKRQARRLRERLSRHDIESEIEIQSWSNGPASVVGVSFPELPISPMFVALGERGKPAEAVADDAAEEAIAYLSSDGMIDEHSADQLLLPLTFADGESAFRVSTISLHLLTNAETIKHFTNNKIHIDGEMGRPGIVRIEGRRL